MPPQMADDIRAALDHLPGLGARALLITGEGRGFCSGADLAGDRSAGGAVSGGARSRNALRGHYNPMLLALANLDIPVVVAVNGPAAGVGCSFALSGDFTIAGKSAYFRSEEHTSELQSLMRISYAVFCLKKKTKK